MVVLKRPAAKKKTTRRKKAKPDGLVIEPLYDRIIAKRLDPITATEAGIFLPDEAQEKPQEGTVISVGPGRLSPATGEFVPMQVKIGDRILFGKYAGLEVETDNFTITILREDEILGIIRKGYLKDFGVRGLPADLAESLKAAAKGKGA